MKKFSIIYIICLVLFSCEDFLDREPLDKIASSAVFTDEGLADAYLTNIYNSVSNYYSGYYMTDNVTDNARSKSGWINSHTVVSNGTTSPDNNPLGCWWKYTPIRKCNEFIAGIESSGLSEEFKKNAIAQARWLRAKFYFELVKRYGDIPLILKAQTFEDDIFPSRTSASEVWKFILDEVDKAIPDLPLRKNVAVGRISKESAQALGSRVALYSKEWQKCIDYSMAIINNSDVKLNSDYDDLFDSYGGDPEVLFEICFDGKENKGHRWEWFNLPASYTASWGSQCNPTQDLVDAYPMLNGKEITDATSGYDPNNPYVNRDKRFAATILYHGAMFKGIPLDIIFKQGKDGLLKTGLHTISGYYIKKHLDESLEFNPGEYAGKVSWKEFRLGEIILNYAEAENELNGPSQAIYDQLLKIRTRAGLPNIESGLNKDNLRIAIMKERRLELAFENHRWWDLIRWERSIDVLHNKYYRGMKITENGDGTLNYDPNFLMDFRPQQKFYEKNYLQPIPQGDIDKNPNLTQNTGY